MAKPRKQKSAAQIEGGRVHKLETDMEAVNLPRDAATLPRQADITVTRAGEQRTKAADDKKAGHDTARRNDAFSALASGMAAGCYDAARRFERDLLTRLGLTERGPALERIDCERGRTDQMVLAGIRVDEVNHRLPSRDFWLLTELIAPPIDRGTWRDHVHYITGERHTEGQAAAVRSACINLRDAYTAIERKAAA